MQIVPLLPYGRYCRDLSDVGGDDGDGFDYLRTLRRQSSPNADDGTLSGPIYSADHHQQLQYHTASGPQHGLVPNAAVVEPRLHTPAGLLEPHHLRCCYSTQLGYHLIDCPLLLWVMHQLSQIVIAIQAVSLSASNVAKNTDGNKDTTYSKHTGNISRTDTELSLFVSQTQHM